MYTDKFPPWPSFTREEADAVRNVLLSGKVNYWTGQECGLFEDEFADYLEVRHCIAVANGTVALELALHGLRIGPGDEVIVSPRTFIASASAIVMRGATPVFADVDPESQNITAETARQVLTPRTRAIITVHLAGWPCDMAPFMELADEYGLKVIEDCAQAHGARYAGRPVGSLGDVAAFSFCQDKIITTGGEGGLVATNDEEVWRRMWAFKDHGKSWELVHAREHSPGFRWLHETFGTNWRLTEMQAAIGRIQLRSLEEWIMQRNANANILRESLKGMTALRIPWPGEDIRHAFYKFYLFIKPSELAEGWSRDRIMTEITNAGVPCFSGSCSEIYLEKAFDGTTSRPEHPLPIARELGATALVLPVHPMLKRSDMENMAAIVCAVVAGATV